jgi:serine/threonine protein kinase
MMQPDDLVGQTLDRYVILRRLGEDPVGVVYKAHDPNLERDVAIRVIHQALAKRPGFADRFAEAARLAARLDHPNLMQVFDFGEARDLLYLVREYIPGEDLAKLLERMRQEGAWIMLPEAVQLVHQLALLFEYLRGQRAPVGAVQPAEVLIKPVHSEGLPYTPVLSGSRAFGLAETSAAAPGQTAPTSSPAFAAYSAPAYLSPEGSLGRPVDARSEVYSLGILLFELSTGQLPFPVRTEEEAVRYHTRGPLPPPRSIRPDLPEELEQIMIRALEKNPAGRHGSPAELAHDLERIYPQVTRIETPPPAMERSASLLVIFQSSQEEPPPAGFEETLPPTQAVQRAVEERREAVEIWMDTPQLSVEPGSSVSTVITVHNTGTVDGSFRVTVEGVPPEWVYLAPTVVRLLPGEQKGVTLTIQPPRAPQSRAGRYPLTIRAADQRNPGWNAVAKGTLTVGVYYEYTSRLYNQRLTSGETGHVAINNQGNTQDSFTLFLRDADGELVFTPPQSQVRLPEGQTAALEFRVEPARARWIGSERIYPYSSQVVSSVGETQTHTGEFVSRPVLPAWVLGIFLLTLLCSAGFLTLLLSRSGMQVSSATATARAQGTALALSFTATAQSGTATAEFLANANQATLTAVTATAAWMAADNDQDGLSNGREIELQTQVDSPDTDRDSLGDGDEVNNRKTDPLRPDTDNDGLSDGAEVVSALNPLNPDTDGDGIPDGQDQNPGQTSTPTQNIAATTAAASTLLAQTQQSGAAQTAAVATAVAGTAAAQAAQTAAVGTALAQAAQTAIAQTAAANAGAATSAAATAAAASTSAAATSGAATSAAASATAAAAATQTAQVDGAVTPPGSNPRLVFFYGTTTTDTQVYTTMLEESGGYLVVAAHQDDITRTDFSSFAAILIGPGTLWDDRSNPEAAEQANAIVQANKPVMGLGRGGANLFTRIGLAIGVGETELPTASDVVVVDPNNPVWRTPTQIPIPGNNTLTLYDPASPAAAPAGSPGTLQIARLTSDNNRFPLVRQERYLLWGFSSGPDAMTDTGEAVFLNMVRSLLP